MQGREGVNQLVLAGPGSGKTKVIVHRVAYLLRVLRMPPRSIIVLTFNRSAAVEVRRRLQALVGSLFDRVFRRYTRAFEERAHRVYGSASPPPP